MSEDRGIKELINNHKVGLLKLGGDLFACPELGFKEVKSNGILTSFLFENGIDCEADICMTGIKATIGSGEGIHIALVADMDALEVRLGLNTVPYHSCGHSVQTAVMAYALKLLKDSGIIEKTGGRVSFIATPAEEFIDFDYRKGLAGQGRIKYFSGKQNMISAGVFDDVDCVISMHINGDSGTLFDVGSTLAGFMVKRVVFLGQAAHSGAAPHMGRNALHGANLCMSGLSYMKDQFPKEAGVQIHPVITSCGGSVNIIPEEVVLDTYVRANTLEELLEAGEKFDLCAHHSAKALGLECRTENKAGYMPLKQSDGINEMIRCHMREICGDEGIVTGVVSGASGDVGDLGFLLPTVQFGFSGIKGRIHSADFTITDEENAYCNTARIVMETVFDLLSDEAEGILQNRALYREKKEFYLRNWLHEPEAK